MVTPYFRKKVGLLLTLGCCLAEITTRDSRPTKPDTEWVNLWYIWLVVAVVLILLIFIIVFCCVRRCLRAENQAQAQGSSSCEVTVIAFEQDTTIQSTITSLQSVFGQAAARRIFAVAHSHNPLQLRPPFSPVSHPLGETVTTCTQSQSSVKQIYLQRNTNHRIEVSVPPYIDNTSTYVKRSPTLSETPTTSSLLPASSVVESASVPSGVLSFPRPTADLPSYLEAMPRFSVFPAATGELCDRDQTENGVKSQPISVHEDSLKNSAPLSETPPCYEDALKMETTVDVMIRRLPLSTQVSNLPPVLETSETEAQAVLH
ncbi:uncharacterized protein LOC127529133 isoform X1 [Erpetoichthys calabaricus]|uniref:uncharacterized protein LOC127529133 isoform X1 n=1 Tax=Erpetoichthys calabaricus TaxID=27687 RepID=UPI0022344030|nr:uncharacterized protein LOC127529133 isoform X1 [Erpetoichthys calabaricus]